MRSSSKSGDREEPSQQANDASGEAECISGRRSAELEISDIRFEISDLKVEIFSRQDIDKYLNS
jgi:hypothetical protein